MGRTRDLEQFQRAVAGLDAGLTAIVDPLVATLDEIRRRAGDPAGLAAGLEATKANLRDLVRQGRELRPPPALAEEAASLLVELDRAARATDLLEHGLDALLAHRGHRELEAQTSLKRAALNLRNARGASARIVGTGRRRPARRPHRAARREEPGGAGPGAVDLRPGRRRRRRRRGLTPCM